MAFDIDILIVYSDQDNKNTSETGNGWVTDFKRFLEMMLIQVLGEKPNIMVKSEHDTITGANLEKVGVVIPILSSAYIGSGECLDVLEEFFKSIKEESARVFKVLKEPLTNDEQPAKLRNIIGYDLYFINPESGKVEDYKDFFGPDAEKNYWMKMVDLAYDLYESLILLQGKEKVADVKTIYTRQAIYLAETGHDLTVQRNIIKRDLQRHGYRILPDHTLPIHSAELQKTIKHDINECSLSIHLIGNSYGDIPDGIDISVVDLQNQIGAQKSVETKDKTAFSRLIWISPNLDNASEKQLAFIENIKRDLAASEGAEILQTPLEDFKNIVREELIDSGIDRKKVSKQAKNGKASIYMLHDKVDSKETEKIKKEIEKAGFKVLTPLFEGELLDLRQHHITNLRDFDAAIIYQGKVNDQWVRMKLLDLLKAPGFGRRKPVIGKAIISNREKNVGLSAYGSQDITIINGDSKSAMDSLKIFLEDLN